MKRAHYRSRLAPRQPLNAAEQDLARDYVSLARRLAWKHYLNCGRRVAIDDLRSEALYALVHAAGTYQGGRRVPFAAYAAMTVGHRLLQAIGRWHGPRSRREVTVTDLCRRDPDERFDPPHGRGRESFEQAAARELVGRVRRVLPPRSFRVLEMYYAQGHTLEEVGRSLGVTRERARQMLLKALDRARLTAVDSF